MKSLKTSVVIAGVAAAAVLLTLGCSQEEREEIKVEHDQNYAARQWDDGVREVNKGLDQMDTFDQKLAEAEPDSAIRHLKKMEDHFNKALTHFEKAEVGREKQGAIDDINAGVDALNKATTDLDGGRVDAAQSQLDKANEHFARASETLDS
jgi:hypothetical protein